MPTDPNDTVKSIADATRSVSDTARQVLQLGERVSAFFARILGKDAAGILSDAMFFFRARNAIALQYKLDRILQERGVAEPRAIPLRLAIPFLQAATLEDDETLQERWARLLANAMDPDLNAHIERCFGSVLEELGPLDCVVFEALATSSPPFGSGPGVLSESLAAQLGVPEKAVSISFGNLRRLELLDNAYFWDAAPDGTPKIPHGVTDFGLAFFVACSHSPSLHG